MDDREWPERQYSWSNAEGSKGHDPSRISSVSDLSDPSTPLSPYNDYRGFPRSISNEGRRHESVLPLPSSSPNTQTVPPTTAGDDDIDISHVHPSSTTALQILAPLNEDGGGQHGTAFDEHDSIQSASTDARTSALSRSSSYGFSGHRRAGSGGEPLIQSPIDRPINKGLTGRFKSFKESANRKLSALSPIERHASSGDEELDMGLMSAAAAMGRQTAAYKPLADGIGGEEQSYPVGYDITSFEGPSLQSNNRIKEYGRLERSGTLSGGLGAGLAPSSSKPILPRNPRVWSLRSMGLWWTARRPAFGQYGAKNRKTIIAGVDDTTTFDPGSATGGNAPHVESDNQNGQSPLLLCKVHSFYPEARWLPNSMRWPYLTMLIVVSIVLAIIQELLYQDSYHKSRMKPPQGLYQYKRPQELNTWDYFSFKYLPTMIAVGYGVLWQITDFEVKRLEPYYQLSRDRLSKDGKEVMGALAMESINVDYITFVSFLRPFKALRLKHYAVTVSSLATLLAVSLVPTLQYVQFLSEYLHPRLIHSEPLTICHVANAPMK